MKKIRTNVYAGIPQSSLSNLSILGNNLKVAIKNRRMRQQDIADAALISLPTLRKALMGNTTVSIGVYIAILSQLQLDDQIPNLAEPASDEIGLALSERNLPDHIRMKESKYDL